MGDLVKRLRDVEGHAVTVSAVDALRNEAADALVQKDKLLALLRWDKKTLRKKDELLTARIEQLEVVRDAAETVMDLGNEAAGDDWDVLEKALEEAAGGRTPSTEMVSGSDFIKMGYGDDD